MIRLATIAKPSVATPKPVLTTDPVNTTVSVNAKTKDDRHRAGYMAEYMRKRRAAQKTK